MSLRVVDGRRRCLLICRCRSLRCLTACCWPPVSNALLVSTPLPPSTLTALCQTRRPAPCRRCCHLATWQEPVAWAPASAAVLGLLRLLRCGPEGANAADREGYTLLHRLALAGQPRCLELLLAAGQGQLDLLVRTRGGANALQLARQQRHEDCVQLLEAATQQAAEARQAALLKVGGSCLRRAIDDASPVQCV